VLRRWRCPSRYARLGRRPPARRYPGVGLIVLGVASEITAIYSHVEADRYRAGSADFNTYASWEKWTQGVAISAAVLAATSWVVDWLVNRDKADPGPPNPLLSTPREIR